MTRPPAATELPDRLVGPITQTDIVRFAGACGDFNPLHHDPDAARRSGFDAPIAMGQYTAGLVGAWLSDRYGIERLRSLEVRFVSAVSLGDSVRLAGSVAEQDGTVARVEFVAWRGEDVAARGQATVEIP